jgi:hypothetical protein
MYTMREVHVMLTCTGVIELIFVKQCKRHGNAQFDRPFSRTFIDTDTAMYAKVRVGY